MDIRQMKVVQAVITSGSTAAAAIRLNVSQPAISKTIKQVEEQIQMPLFERSGGRLRPTLEASALLPDIQRMLSGYDTVQRRISEVRNGQRGMIRLAVASMVASRLMPETILRYRVDHPQVGFAITTATTEEVIRLVTDNKVDLGICQRGHNHGGVSSREICTARMVCAMPEDHPLAGLEQVSPGDLMPYPLILSSFNEPHLGSLIADTFTRDGYYPHVTLESNLSVSSFALVRVGLGVALVDSQTLPPSGVVTRVYRPFVGMHVHMVFPTDQPLSPLVNSFCERLTEVGADLSVERVSDV